jgi:SAM-dependent methyltransferase
LSIRAAPSTIASMTRAAEGGESGRRHWESVYTEKNTDEVSWFEPTPSGSLAMLETVGAAPSMAVIDVGAGASRLAAALLNRGFTDITALDVADEGLALARRELGSDADKITWVAADLLTWSPDRRFDIWHDRAVFHFLTSPEQQRRYLQTGHTALQPDARLIIATFAEDGSQQCGRVNRMPKPAEPTRRSTTKKSQLDGEHVRHSPRSIRLYSRRVGSQILCHSPSFQPAISAVVSACHH